MRESQAEKNRRRVLKVDQENAVAYDEKAFFESHYSATVRGEPTDRMTIGAVSDIESRFHYNSTENSIIRALARIEPVPSGPTAGAWKMMRQRQGLRLLDVGTGTGHWIDFMWDVFDVTQAIAIEITEAMAGYLEKKYTDRDVRVLRDDVASPMFTSERIGGPVNYVTAIGVMFHIVDDIKWRRALNNLASVLAPDGVMLIGGDFGVETRNVQFHSTDTFSTWSEHDRAAKEQGMARVNKRLRSLADWTRAASDANLEIVDLVRSDSEPSLTTPENDVLALRLAKR